MSVLTFRTDPAVDQAIGLLMKDTGEGKSQVIREAILQAERKVRHRIMQEESLALREDAADQAECRAVLAFMGGGDAW